MKISHITILVLTLVISNLAYSSGLQTYFDYKLFYAPEIGPYVETYLTFDSQSLSYKPNENGALQATVEALIMIKSEDEIIAYKKRKILSPATTDSNFVHFVNQERFKLGNGSYTFEILLVDLNLEKRDTTSLELPFSVDFNEENGPFISDIELVENYTKADKKGWLSKSGYNLVPYFTNYYPKEVSTLTFYFEVYGTAKHLTAEEKFLLSYSIVHAETKNTAYHFIKSVRQQPAAVIPVLHKFDIQSLPSGNYYLNVEIKNRENQLIKSKKLLFQRNNPIQQVSLQELSEDDLSNTFVSAYANVDTLQEHIWSLRPISNDMETAVVDNQILGKDLKKMQSYFYSFWLSRNSADPEREWLTYLEEVKKAQKQFGTKIKRGYETDRGRVFLKYGAPNAVADRAQEPSAYPYQIWHYHKANKYNNKRFVFYNPDLVSNDYQLLHSDVPGEITNAQWIAAILARDRPQRRIDEQINENRKRFQSDPYNQYGSQIRELYQNPR